MATKLFSNNHWNRFNTERIAISFALVLVVKRVGVITVV